MGSLWYVFAVAGFFGVLGVAAGSNTAQTI
jgi:hypothetical protein